MPDEPAAEPSFAALLRRYRRAAGLTQEQLAERAGLSARAVSDLERGDRSARRSTLDCLVPALGLDMHGRTVFEQARTRARSQALGKNSVVGSALPAPEAPLPAGMLAILVADVRGYTAFTHLRGDAAGAHLALRFAALAAEVILGAAGKVVEVRGDEVLAVFTSARAALQAAIALLARCADETSDDLPLRAGIGLDVGEPVAVPGGYRGEAINTAARLCARARPGEVLASEAAVGLARHIQGLAYRDRGTLALKGIARPVRAWLVEVGDGAPEDAVPLSPFWRVPAPPTAFIGREGEITAVGARLLDAETRLVTLVGPGGVGKTRLAMQVAMAIGHQFPDGIAFVSLATLVDPAFVLLRIAQALGVHEVPDHSMRETLASFLQGKRLLLMLDNFEQLLPAATAVGELLAAVGSGLTVLVTSRSALRIQGEKLHQVVPLTVPRPPLPALAILSQYEAVRLFIARAQDVQPTFAVTNETAPAVAEICARLDGLPLAIEIVAARIQVLSPEGILARLGDRLRLATGGARDLPDRQRTLRATIDWSYNLLEPAEKTLFARVAVFAGGGTLEAIEAICDPDDNLGVDPLDGVHSLLHKSLLQRDDQVTGEPRLVLLQTVHEYARERLAASGEQEALETAHARYYLALGEETAPHLTGAAQGRWLDALETEHDNLRVMLRWARETGVVTEALRLAGALWRFWYLRGHLTEGSTFLGEVLSHAEGAGDRHATAAWATAAHGASVLAWVQADYDRAEQLGERALQVWRTLADRPGMAASLNLLGLVAMDRSVWERAEAVHTESLSLRDPQDHWGRATSLHNLGTVARHRGDRARARTLYNESLTLRQAQGDVAGLAISYREQAALALAEGDDMRAVALYRASVGHASSLKDTTGIAIVLDGLALVAVRRERLELATQFLSVAAFLREQVGAATPPRERGDLARLVDHLRAALGMRFDAVSTAARELSWEELVGALVEEGAV
jgi:predicted ATPase/class 3 adenylate cyclase